MRRAESGAAIFRVWLQERGHEPRAGYGKRHSWCINPQRRASQILNQLNCAILRAVFDHDIAASVVLRVPVPYEVRSSET
jgi:hypothetical protein